MLLCRARGVLFWVILTAGLFSPGGASPAEEPMLAKGGRADAVIVVGISTAGSRASCNGT
jgi:hypothetical protein